MKLAFSVFTEVDLYEMEFETIILEDKLFVTRAGGLI